ncbi:MAG: MFS transporter [Nitrospina sp.]|jgi:MFS transporter, NNP family, nitrate/nitrite transporter|nr:MFS transporter [Nitrospina sp.]MBT3876708.1 MFS transporter [Nitrospina sp.]MBT4047835.1 MFS transporter [Nitrospina sp.]MBT4558604.1 MFS transporter [Nitrospina sp.]MBT5349291.1 MFS transporter [Nitrospina sp.]
MLGFSKTQWGTLHLNWVAFFMTFVAWFNMAPFNTTIMHALGLSSAEINVLMICNVALTIPARIIIGFWVDKYGPQKVFSSLLIFSGLVCFGFALSQGFKSLLFTRLLMGIVGGGFVVGIKMIAEWFPPEKMGTAQGIYAGWGNFGSAFAVFFLPLIALPFSEDIGWRVATGFSGLSCLIWAGVYYKFCPDAPGKGRGFPVHLHGVIEVTSYRDLILHILILIPIYGAMALFIWKLSEPPFSLIPNSLSMVLILGMVFLLILNGFRCWQVNTARLQHTVPEEEKYAFSQIAILSLVYSLTFGSELAVISMFPQFLQTTFSLSVGLAGILASSYAFMNLIARPGGGWISDRFGRKRTLFIMVMGGMVSHWFMSDINSNWQLTSAIALTIVGSIFLKAGSGACFAVIPLISKPLTGKMAGLAGAYGSVGAVFFLTLFSFVTPQIFFKIIAGYSFLVFLCLFFLQPFSSSKKINN